jgi:hypothetical protein
MVVGGYDYLVVAAPIHSFVGPHFSMHSARFFKIQSGIFIGDYGYLPMLFGRQNKDRRPVSSCTQIMERAILRGRGASFRGRFKIVRTPGASSSHYYPFSGHGIFSQF